MPTFGYTTQGATTSGGSNACRMQLLITAGADGKLTAASGDELDFISTYISTSSTDPTVSIYDVTSGAASSSRQFAAVTIDADAIGGWDDSAAINHALTAGQVYALAIFHPTVCTVRFDTGPANARSGDSSTSLPATWSASPSAGTQMYSLYGTYTAGTAGVTANPLLGGGSAAGPLWGFVA